MRLSSTIETRSSLLKRLGLDIIKSIIVVSAVIGFYTIIVLLLNMPETRLFFGIVISVIIVWNTIPIILFNRHVFTHRYHLILDYSNISMSEAQLLLQNGGLKNFKLKIDWLNGALYVYCRNEGDLMAAKIMLYSHVK